MKRIVWILLLGIISPVPAQAQSPYKFNIAVTDDDSKLVHPNGRVITDFGTGNNVSIDSLELGFNDHGDVAFQADWNNLDSPLSSSINGIHLFNAEFQAVFTLASDSPFSTTEYRNSSGPHSGVALNNAGEVAFRRQQRQYQSSTYGPPVNLTIRDVRDDVQITTRTVGDPMNVKATVTFTGTSLNSNSSPANFPVSSPTGGSIIDGVGLYPSTSSPSISAIGEAEIDSAGNVAFFAEHSQGASSGLFTQDDMLIDFSDPLHGQTVTSFSKIAMNDVGDVAISAEFNGMSRSIVTRDLILVSGGALIGGVAINLPSNPDFDLNDNRDVIFAQAEGIFSRNELLIQDGVTAIENITIMDTLLAPTPTFLNNDGTFVFKGLFDDPSGGQQGIFTQHGLVIKTGDVILGQSITSLGSASINEHGDIAFFASFSDGRKGIVVATLVPEPGSIAYLALVFGATSVRRRTAKKRFRE